jgi:hypothetical protein
MDHALLERTLSVSGVSGKIAIRNQETEWRFTPDSPWKAGNYELAIDSDLEDICGNRLDRPFDVDLRAPAATQTAVRVKTLRFRVP